MARFRAGGVNSHGFGVVVEGNLTPTQQRAIRQVGNDASITKVTPQPGRIDFRVAHGISPNDVQYKVVKLLTSVK